MTPSRTILGIIGLIMALLLLSTIRYNCSGGVSTEPQPLDTTVIQELKRQRDSLGRELVTYEIQEVELRTIIQNDNAELAALKYRMFVAEAKVKDLLSTTSVTTKTTDTIYLVKKPDTLLVATGASDTTFSRVNEYKDTWLSFALDTRYTVKSGLITVDSISAYYTLSNRLHLDTYTKSYLFKKELRLTVTNDNPNTVVSDTHHYTVIVKPRWYESWWFNFTIGAASGYTLGRLQK